jgi:hypothetical protein
MRHSIWLILIPFVVGMAQTQPPPSDATIYYYLYEYTDEEGDPGACIIETPSDVSPGPEFEQLTLEEFHQRGYLTADEQMAQTPPVQVDAVEFGIGRDAESWIILWRGSTGDYRWEMGSRTRTEHKEYIRVEWDAARTRLLAYPPPKVFHYSGSDYLPPLTPPREVTWRQQGRHGETYLYEYRVVGLHWWTDPPPAPWKRRTEAWDSEGGVE